MRPVAVNIVTGALGAGKTTLLSHVLAGELEGERVAIVMNELGEVGIDGRVIEGLDHIESMVELSSGCVCCSIEDTRFDFAIDELIRRADPTLIVLETTGVADPEPVAERVTSLGLGLDAIITVVDAANYWRMDRETTVTKRQVAGADFLVVSKTDLVSDRELARLHRRLRWINRRAARFDTVRGRGDVEVLFGSSVRRLRAGGRQGGELGSAVEACAAPTPADLALTEGASADVSSTDGAPGQALGQTKLLRPKTRTAASRNGGFETFSYRGGCALDRRRFERFLARLPKNIVRAKGFVRFSGNDWACMFNFTCGRSELKWVRLNVGEAQAVFIGRDVLAARERILRDLARCEVHGAHGGPDGGSVEAVSPKPDAGGALKPDRLVDSAPDPNNGDGLTTAKGVVQARA